MFRTERYRTPLAISLGAVSGALLRYYLTLGAAYWLGHGFPIGTCLVNLTGAFGLGFFTTWICEQASLSSEIQLGVTVGFFGSYTTFSSYELDAETLLIHRHSLTALLFWLGTALLGVLCLEAGSAFAKKLR